MVLHGLVSAAVDVGTRETRVTFCKQALSVSLFNEFAIEQHDIMGRDIFGYFDTCLEDLCQLYKVVKNLEYILIGQTLQKIIFDSELIKITLITAGATCINHVGTEANLTGRRRFCLNCFFKLPFYQNNHSINSAFETFVQLLILFQRSLKMTM